MAINQSLEPIVSASKPSLYSRVRAYFQGSVTLVALAGNTLFWCPVVYVLGLLKLTLPAKALSSAFSKATLWCSENWVAFNSSFLSWVQRVQWDVRGGENLNQLKSYFITANHQSWVDIIVLQKIFNRKIPFPRFFVKKQLIWVPFLGIAFKALDFPFMNRFSKDYLKKHPEKKGVDMEITQRACRKISGQSFSLINFLEGTRFTPNKSKKQASPFKHHLKPKAGGLAFALEAFEGKVSSLLDVTIVYPTQNVSLWALLKGRIPKVIVSIREISLPSEFLNKNYNLDPQFREDFQRWINELWKQKDAQYQLLAAELA